MTQTYPILPFVFIRESVNCRRGFFEDIQSFMEPQSLIFPCPLWQVWTRFPWLRTIHSYCFIMRVVSLKFLKSFRLTITVFFSFADG